MKNHMERRGFSLIEVTVALAMFALIAIPAIGLMTMSARKANNRFGVSNASELKERIEQEITASDAWMEWNFGSDIVTLYASSDLSVIEYSDTLDLLDGDKHFRISIEEPVGYIYDDGQDAYRIFVYNVVWPAYVESGDGEYVSNEDNPASLEQMIFTSVISK